jgi:hypothetical protein
MRFVSGKGPLAMESILAACLATSDIETVYAIRLQIIEADPPASTVPLLNAILAALAEQLSDEYDIERPRWTRAFGALEDPWSPPSTPRMRAAFEETTPEAFRRRNLVLSRSTLFRSVRTSSD